jgi:oligopeptide/dipeptide ABC transporter ATP-binding protein
MTLLEVEDLYTHYHTKEGIVRAVDGVDLSVESGEIVGIVGESGSGKSVLARSVMRLVDHPGEIHSGDIQLNSESLLDKSEEEMRKVRGGSISMVFQNPMKSLNTTHSVGEQIAESVRLHQDVGESVSFSAEMRRKLLGATKNSEAWRRAIDMLEAVGIPEPGSRATSYPHEFSGGMRQRAMIAMALSGEPDLLIADEPTTALDVTIQAQMLEELHALKDAFETSVVLITHDLAVIAETCDVVNVMYAGNIVETAHADELFNNPRHPYTQALLNSTPQLDRSRSSLEPIPGQVPDLIGMPDVCRFAPRCDEMTSGCLAGEPAHRKVGTGENHTAACIHRDGGNSSG